MRTGTTATAQLVGESRAALERAVDGARQLLGHTDPAQHQHCHDELLEPFDQLLRGLLVRIPRGPIGRDYVAVGPPGQGGSAAGPT